MTSGHVAKQDARPKAKLTPRPATKPREARADNRRRSRERVRRHTAKLVSADTMGQNPLQNQYDLHTPRKNTNRAKATTRQTLRTPTFERRKGVDATSDATQRRYEI